MITRDRMNVVAQKYEPDPNLVDYWVDLSEDPTGNVIKSYSDGKWLPLNWKANKDQWHHIQEIVDAVGLQRTEDDVIVLPANENTYFTGDSITEQLANADGAMNNMQDDIEELQEFAATKGKPGGLAGLDPSGTVPRDQLPSYVDDVIDVYATFHVSDTGILSNIHLYRDAEHTDEITEGEPDKIYVNITNQEDPGFDEEGAGDDKYKAIPYQFRWSGTQFVHIDSNVLILGEIKDTAFDGGRGKALETTIGTIDKLVQQIDETPEFNENSVTIAFTQGSKNESGEFQYVSENIELTAASATAAGVMTSTDKKVVDTAATIPNTIITDGEVEQIDSSDVKLHLTQYQKDESGHYVDSQKQNLVINAVSETIAGVMTSDMYTQLTTTLPGQIESEAETREQQYNALDQKGTAFEAEVEEYQTKTDKELSKIKEDIKSLTTGAGLQEDFSVPDTTSDNTHYITDSESVFGAVEKLDETIYSILKQKEELWYGVKFNFSSNSGSHDGVRTGNLDMHKELPIQSKMRGCVILDTDNTIKYLDPDDWKRYADGSAVADDIENNQRVNFFVEIPEHYRLFVQTPDNNIEIRISEYNLPGYTHIERKYVGAYEATTDPSYAEGTPDTGANNLQYKVLWSRPDWQKPVVSMKRNDMQKAARKSPDIVTENNRTNNWNMYTYGAHVDITWLFVVEYATLYSQKAFTNALTSEGYHQGGLGSGVTTGLSQTGVYSWVPAGVTHKLGSHTGVAEYTEGTTQAGNVETPDTSQNNGNTSTSNKKTEVPRYRGIENPFGHVWKNVIDVVITGDGAKPHNVYVCKDYTKFSDNIAQSISSPFSQEGYELQPFTEVPKQGYLNKLVGTNYGDLFAKECTGTATTYYTDYHWTYTSNSSDVAHTLLIGGCSDVGAHAGLFALYSGHGVGNSSVAVGTRLTFYGDPTDKAAEAAIATAYASQPVPEYGDGPMIFD